MSKSKKIRDKKIKISACYIVKNNSAELKLSLERLKNFVGEIIVVDTGSTDSTVEVARSFGAKIFHEVWQDDFSTPRNLALQKTKGDWIIFLDADEYFSEETAKNIPAIVERSEQANINALQIYLVNIDKDDGNKIQDTDHVIRIMKNLPELHYIGKIHEELRVGENFLSNVATVPQNLLTLYHTGYSTSLNRAKAERNLKMLLAELKETNEPERIFCYIAECYNGLGDVANAAKFALLDINADNSTKKIISYRLLLSILANEKNLSARRYEIASRAVEDFPNLPEFNAELAECLAKIGDFWTAIETMQDALKKFKNYNDTEPTQFNESMAKVAKRRMKFWIKIAIDCQLPMVEDKKIRKWWLNEVCILTEEHHEKN